MRFPNAETIGPAFHSVEFPEFARISYEPDHPEIDDIDAATRAALDDLPFDLPEGASIAVGVGSRGIHDIADVAQTTISYLQEHNFDPFVIPAMGSHGGATPDGQIAVFEGLGIDEDRLGCRIDPRMETEIIGTATVNGTNFDVQFATSALEADAVLPINRIKAHTSFIGHIESGINKMLVVGFGKQPGAHTMHELAVEMGFVPVIESAVEVILEEVSVVGGIGIIENFYDHTSQIEGIPVDNLPDGERPLLEIANRQLGTLPFDDIDILIVDEIGKDISGTGMDTNVVGRYYALTAPEPERPNIKRIYVRNLTEATHGNGHGIGLADFTRQSVIDQIDLDQVYMNAMTGAAPKKARLPVVLPHDELALTAAASSVGAYNPETSKIVWMKNTLELSSLYVSTALLDDLPPQATVRSNARLMFDDDGEMHFDDIDQPMSTTAPSGM